MRDWVIRLDICTPEGMPTPEHEGYCEFTERGYARIRILGEEFADPASYCPYDAELLLVHELLHIRTGLHADEGTPEWWAQERNVEALARALVSLKRRDA